MPSACTGSASSAARPSPSSARNRPKLYWSVMAVQMLGAVPVPVYADAVADELAFVLAHAEVRFAAVEDQEQIDKIQSVLDRLPKLEQMVYDETRGLRDYDHARLHAMDDVIADGRKALAGDPAVGAVARRRDRRRQGLRSLHHPLHLRHHRPVQGRGAHRRALDHAPRPTPSPSTSSPRTTSRSLICRSPGSAIIISITRRAWCPASAPPARKIPTPRWPTCARSGRPFISRRRARSKCCSPAS